MIRKPHETEDFGPRGRIVVEDTHHPGRAQGDAWGVDATCRHAGVTGLNHNCDAKRLKVLPDTVRNLRGQSFLYLQTVRVAVQHAGEL